MVNIHLDCGSWRILGFGDGGGDLCLLLAVYTLPRHNPDGLICCAKLLLSGVKLLHATSVHCSWSAWTCIASHCIDLNHTFALQYCPAHCLSVHFAKPPLLNIGVEPICESGTFEKLTLTLRKLKWSKPNVSLEKRKYSSGQRWSYRRSSCKTKKIHQDTGVKFWNLNFQFEIENFGKSWWRFYCCKSATARVVRNALASSQLFECNYKGLVQCIYSQRIKWDIMKVVILLGSPTDMYLDISRSKWIGEPNYFLSALLQHFPAALFSLLPPPNIL